MTGGWLADQLARLEVLSRDPRRLRDTRCYAEDWTYRFISTALADEQGPVADG